MVMSIAEIVLAGYFICEERFASAPVESNYQHGYFSGTHHTGRGYHGLPKCKPPIIGG
jgi:hypothetical protein